MISCLVRTLSDGYELDDDPARIDRVGVHRYLSEESYWAAGRPREVMDELISTAARVVGLYAPDGSQVGFARVVSDGHTVSYLADVYVLEEARGNGFGLEVARFAVDQEPLRARSSSSTPGTCTRCTPSSASLRPTTRLMERWPGT